MCWHSLHAVECARLDGSGFQVIVEVGARNGLRGKSGKLKESNEVIKENNERMKDINQGTKERNKRILEDNVRMKEKLVGFVFHADGLYYLTQQNKKVCMMKRGLLIVAEETELVSCAEGDAFEMLVL